LIRNLITELAWLYIVSPALVQALHALGPPRLEEVAIRWAQSDDCRRKGLGATELTGVLQNLSALIQRRADTENLYLLIRLA